MTIDKNKLYNPEIKMDYLNTFDNEQSKITIAYILYKAKDIEEIYAKDLYEFDIEEIKNVLHNTNPLNRMIAKTNGLMISNYISWAIEKGLKKSNLNPLADKSVEWYEQFVDKSKKIFWSDEEIRNIIKKCVNAQDQVIIQLIFFEGVSGYALSELCNLHYYDVDWNNNIVRLKDDRYGERKIKMSDESIRIIKSAYQEEEYQKTNGHSDAKNPIAKLIPSDYILKNIQSRRTKNHHGVDKHTIYRRLSTIGEYFNYPYFNAKNIQKSGMIYMAKELYLRDGKLEKEQLYEVAERFGVRKQKINGYEFYNTTLLKEFINAENIKDLYDIDIKNI
jgi:integrase